MLIEELKKTVKELWFNLLSVLVCSLFCLYMLDSEFPELRLSFRRVFTVLAVLESASKMLRRGCQ